MYVDTQIFEESPYGYGIDEEKANVFVWKVLVIKC